MGVDVDPRRGRRAARDRLLAAHRDRQGAGAGRPGPDHGRADRQPRQARDRGAVRAHRAAQGSAASRSSTSRTGWTRSTGSPTGSPSCATAGGCSPRPLTDVDARSRSSRGSSDARSRATWPTSTVRGRPSARLLLEARGLCSGTRRPGRVLHAARRRDPRPRRADGQRPDRARALPVRHRPAVRRRDPRARPHRRTVAARATPSPPASR